jgi:hypothetical protein
MLRPTAEQPHGDHGHRQSRQRKLGKPGRLHQRNIRDLLQIHRCFDARLLAFFEYRKKLSSVSLISRSS